MHVAVHRYGRGVCGTWVDLGVTLLRWWGLGKNGSVISSKVRDWTDGFWTRSMGRKGTGRIFLASSFDFAGYCTVTFPISLAIARC
jgi:hypothetical protein